MLRECGVQRVARRLVFDEVLEASECIVPLRRQSLEQVAELTEAGATVKDAAHQVGGGRLVATVADPDGNVLGLIQDR